MPRAPARQATGGSSGVAQLVRLHHQRREWAWVATGSVIGLVVYVGIGVNLFDNLTGTAQIRARSAEQLIPIAVTTEAAFAAVHTAGEVGAELH